MRSLWCAAGLLFTLLICFGGTFLYFGWFRSKDTAQLTALRHCMSAANVNTSNGEANEPSTQAYREIFCQGPILNAVQDAGLFSDSKYFVDMPLKKNPVETLRGFYCLGEKIHDTRVLMNFVEEHFNPPGSELEACFPHDWTQIPDKIDRIKNATYHKFAIYINSLWKNLCRRVKEDVLINPTFYTMLYVPEPFIIPGGRFREMYYWDSYWIIKGLLVSGMFDTAEGMIRNFGYMVEHYGFVPNGGRVYYLLRSQPPLLTPMVYDFYQATKDQRFLEEMLPLLEKEYNFWTSHRSTKFSSSKTFYQYKVEMTMPRPESYREDMELVKNISTATDKKLIWSNVASATETGWDFSSRWFAYNGSKSLHMGTVRTKSIVPVCLNAFICMNTRLLAKLFTINGENKKAQLFFERLNDSKALMEQMHWNEEDGIWYDYDLENNAHRKEYYISNAVPLWAHCYFQGQQQPMKVFNYMNRVGAFNYTGAIPTSFIKSEHQWDNTNSWPPMVHMVIEGFRTSGDEELKNFSRKLAEQWVQVNYEVYEKTKSMYEKYASSVDQEMPNFGSGGEYEVQTGFGWTNGVVLDLLSKFSDIGTSASRGSLFFHIRFNIFILLSIVFSHLLLLM